MPEWHELEYVYDIGPAQFVTFPRALYPPDHPDGPSQNGPDVEAYKRIVSKLGRWRWPGTGSPPAPQFDRSFSNAFAHGKSGNVRDSGLEGVQRQAGVAKASGALGERTYDILLYARIPKGLDNAGEFACDDKAIMLLQEAARLYPKDEAPQTAPRDARDVIVETALLGHQKHGQIHYTQDSRRMWGVREEVRPDDVPPYEDCSSFATWCYWVAGAPDPNGLGYNGTGYTGTQVNHGHRISASAVQPGDLVFYGPSWGNTSHVTIATGGGNCVSHGSEGGPYYSNIWYRGDVLGAHTYL